MPGDLTVYPPIYKGLQAGLVPSIGTAASGSFLKADGTWSTITTSAGSFTAPASTDLTLNAGSGNKNLVLVPSGTGITKFTGASQNSWIGSDSSVSYGNLWLGLASATAAGANNYTLQTSAASNVTTLNTPSASGRIVFSIANGAAKATIANNGNFLLGTITDSSNGIIQLAASTSAGSGIGFGTDVAFYRAAAGTLALDTQGAITSVLRMIRGTATSGAAFGLGTIDIYNGTTLAAEIIGLSGSATDAGFFEFRTKASGGSLTAALTLTTAQNATFAGTIAFSGGNSITAAASADLTLAAGATNQNVVLAPSGTGFTTTAFGARITGSATFTGGPGLELSYASRATVRAYNRTGAAYADLWLDANTQQFQIQGTSAIQISVGRNVLFGSGNSTDNSNGVIQLASSSSASAGIGFGADTTLYRTAAGALALSSTGTNPLFKLLEGSTITGSFQTSSGTVYLSNETAGSLILRTNNIAALTFSSSQNSTFAGTVTLPVSTGTPAAATGGYLQIGTVVTLRQDGTAVTIGANQAQVAFWGSNSEMGRFAAGAGFSVGTTASAGATGNILAAGAITSLTAGIATTTTDGHVLTNTTASTSGVQVQYAPRLRFTGHAWNTTATAADNYVELIQEWRPASAATPTGKMAWGYRRSTDGSTGSFTDVMTIDSTGRLVINADISAPNSPAGGAIGPFTYNGNTFDWTAANYVSLGSNVHATKDVWTYNVKSPTVTDLTLLAPSGQAIILQSGNATALTLSSAQAATFAGSVIIGTAGSTLSVKSGANAASGTVTLTAGAGTITSTAITANSVIVFSDKTVSGTPSVYQPVATVSAGSATVTGLATDNSTYNWVALLVS